ncbi:MAG: hypothetical protein RL691_994 [Actinomycetota bacterium]
MTNQPTPASLGWKKWILGARPRTLPAAVVPVFIGLACAASSENSIWWRAVLAGVVSLALQVGVNYANDYSDGIKGTDAVRVGPLRLVGSGVASASSVKRAAFVAFGIAAVAGLALAIVTTWLLILVGVVSIAAAWTYTGGPRPYGYAGLGEVFVFVFFGVVATIGTEYVVAEQMTLMGLLFSVLAFLSIFWVMISKINDPFTPMGWSSLLVAVLFLGSIQLVCLGILGEYLGRLFLNSNKRPQFSIRRIHRHGQVIG